MVEMLSYSKKKKILFVNPPYFLDRSIDFEVMIPINLAYLCRVASECHWKSEIFDMALEEKEGNNSFELFQKYLKDPGLKIVGISNHTVRSSITSREIAKLVKRYRPDVKVILGGVNATFMWEKLIKDDQNIDFILRGYAQSGLRAFLSNYHLAKIPGLVYRDNNVLKKNKIQHIDQMDFRTPNLEFLNINRYLRYSKTYPLFTHAGCNYSCNYCTSVMPETHKEEKFRDIQDIIREMKFAVNKGFNNFFMSANNFTSNKEWCINLCREIIKSKISNKAKWVCMTRIDFIDETIVTELKAANCVNIGLGLEIASKEQWNYLKKGIYFEALIKKNFNLLYKNGIETSAFIILGSPFQKKEDIDKTIILLNEINPSYRIVNFFQPFPGTPFWDNSDVYGLSNFEPLEKWNFHEGPVCDTKFLKKKELIVASLECYFSSKIDKKIEISDEFKNLLSSFKNLEEMPSSVIKTMSFIDGNTSIKTIFNKIRQKFGAREWLISIYWFSTALKEDYLTLVRNKSLKII